MSRFHLFSLLFMNEKCDYFVSYVGRVNYVVSLVSLTSLLDRRSEDLGEETTGLQVMSEYTTNTTSSASP